MKQTEIKRLTELAYDVLMNNTNMAARDDFAAEIEDCTLCKEAGLIECLTHEGETFTIKLEGQHHATN